MPVRGRRRTHDPASPHSLSAVGSHALSRNPPNGGETLHASGVRTPVRRVSDRARRPTSGSRATRAPPSGTRTPWCSARAATECVVARW